MRVSGAPGGRRLAVRSLAVGACVALLAGCGLVGGQPSASRTWSSQVTGPPPAVDPQVPGQTPGRPGNPNPGTPGLPPGRSGGKGDPNVIAQGLAAPWGLSLLPDGSALVGERDTGRILQVQPNPEPVHEVMRIRGLDTGGDGGLLGIAVSPTYQEDGLVYAYVSTAGDNRIIRFPLGGTPTPIFTGIPRSAGDDGGRIAFGPDGDLYVGTGDAGHPALAGDRHSLAGKVLRITVFGKPAPGNPVAGSPVFASGFHDVLGLCWNQRKELYATDAAGRRTDEVNLVRPGEDYGWPRVEGASRRRGPTNPLVTFTPAQASPGGCAVLGYGLFVGALTGQRLLSVPLDTAGRPTGAARSLFTHVYGRLRSVVAAPDGALWVTTSNRDGHGRPTALDDRVLRILPPSGTTTSPL